MRRAFTPAIVLTGIVMICAGVASAQTTAPATAPTYPESSQGLSSMFKDILAATDAADEKKLLALTRLLPLPKPKAWFVDVFGNDLGTKLATEYDTEMKDFPLKLALLFARLKSPKDLEVTVVRVETPDDPNIKAYQLFAINAMLLTTPLYTVTVKPKEGRGSISLWSLVYVDGNFRMAGKMTAIRDTPPPPDVGD